MALEDFEILTSDEIRDRILRQIKFELLDKGVSNPLIAYGSEYYIQAQSFADQIYAATNSIISQTNNFLPDTAQGAALLRLASIYGIELRVASKSKGKIRLSSSVSTPIAISEGTVLSAPDGSKFKVSVGGSFHDLDLIDIESIDTGEKNNLEKGIVLLWNIVPSFANSTAVIAEDMVGGTDNETQEELRARLLSRIKYPAGSGNWSQVKTIAEYASSAVQSAFIYPAVNGPSTYAIALAKAPSEKNKSRQVPTSIINNDVYPLVLKYMPEYASMTIKSVVDVPVNVSIGVSIPTPPLSSFPYHIPSSLSMVTSTTSAVEFNVLSSQPPNLMLDCYVCWISKNDWKLRKAKVVSYTEIIANQEYKIKIDTPFSDYSGSVFNGDYIFPYFNQAEICLQSFLSAMSKVGPGELTNLPSLLPRALRRPLTTDQYFDIIGPHILRELSSTSFDLLDVQYLYRSEIKPTLPTSVLDGPNIFVPHNIGFYFL